MDELQPDSLETAREEPQDEALTPEEARDAQAFLIDEKLLHLFHIQFFVLFLFVAPLSAVISKGFIVQPSTLAGFLTIILDIVVYYLLFICMCVAAYLTVATIKCFRNRVKPDQNVKTAAAVAIACGFLAANIAVFLAAVLQNAGIVKGA